MKAKRIDFTLKNGHKEYDGIAEWDASGALVNCQIMDEDDGFLGDKVEAFLRKGGKVKDGMVLVTDLDTGMVGFFHNQQGGAQMSTKALDRDGFIDCGSYRLVPVREGQGRTVLEPAGRYYSLPTEYSLSYNDNMHQHALFTVCVDMLDRLPERRAAILSHLAACGIYLEGYNEPKELQHG